MSELGIEIVKTEENEECGIKYLNINVSNSEVERKPDIVRLCSDVGILEYAKPKIGHWIEGKYRDDDIRYNDRSYKCDKCGKVVDFKENYCPNCGAIMLEPQESEEK